MSMREHVVDDYGLILGEEDIRILAEKVCEDYSDSEFDEDPEWFQDRISDEFGFDFITGFTGETILLSDSDNCVGTDSIYYEEDVIRYLRATYYPSLFTRAYRNMDELVDEFRQALGDYLPDTFDYQAHLYHIVGTCFG